MMICTISQKKCIAKITLLMYCHISNFLLLSPFSWPVLLIDWLILPKNMLTCQLWASPITSECVSPHHY